MPSLIRRHQVSVFLAIAFGWSWAYWAGVVRPLELAESRWAQIPFAWGPLVASLLVTSVTGKNAREWTRRIVTSNIKLYWYVLAFILPFVDVFVRLGMSLFGVPIELAEHSARTYPQRFFTTLLIAGALEEFGWRGFLQPQLQKRYSALTAAIIVGIIWATWHLPVVVFDGAGYNPGDLLGMFLLLPLFSVVMAWLYNANHGAILLPMLFHASVNTPQPIVFSQEASGVAMTISGLIVLGFWVVLSVAITIRYRRKDLANRKSALPD